MIVVIDNFDSFTYNLVQYLRELGSDTSVFRNDEVSVQKIKHIKPDHIVVSPGPGTPKDAGVSINVIRFLGPEIPILGVCLGHQCLGEVFGGTITQADRLMHGKTSQVYHDGTDLFAGIPNPFVAARYHSLIVSEPIPPSLQVTAFTETKEIMGLKHRVFPIHGVQFHPESILTPFGKQILANFLSLTS